MLKNLVGFESIKSTLLSCYRNQKLPHAILLDGKKGSGKASFVKEFIGEILESGSSINPNLLLVEKESEKKEITIDKVRKITEFINRTAAVSLHKFIIIDSACELNRSASNALLKILEEPNQNNFLVLISHNLSRVLPTIKSRCQIIKIHTLTLENFMEILRQKNPKISAKEIEFLAEICDNSPACAINMGAELSSFYELFLDSLINKKLHEELLKKFSQKNPDFFTVFEKVVEFFFNRWLKFICQVKLNFFFNEQKIFEDFAQKSSAQKIFFMIDESMNSLHKTSSLNLDKRLCLTNIFNRICY